MLPLLASGLQSRGWLRVLNACSQRHSKAATHRSLLTYQNMLTRLNVCVGASQDKLARGPYDGATLFGARPARSGVL